MNWMSIFAFHYTAFKRQAVFRAVLASQQIERKVQIFHRLSAPHMCSLPYYQHPASDWYICFNQWTYIDTNLQLILGFHLQFGTFYGFGLMTCMHHYKILYKNIFIALRTFCVPSVHPPSTNTWKPRIFLISPQL